MRACPCSCSEGIPAWPAPRLRACRPAVPRLGDVGFYCPPFGFEDDAGEMDRIRRMLSAARPDLVLVGLGFPKQERVIRVLRPELPGAWFAGVGISLSFLAGDQPRAPLVLQRLGLEWMHRLWHEPRRLVPALCHPGPPVRREAVRRGHWRVASAAQPSGLARPVHWSGVFMSVWISARRERAVVDADLVDEPLEVLAVGLVAADPQRVGGGLDGAGRPRGWRPGCR